MSEFLTTTGVSHHLEQLIKDSGERLILISPYLRVNSRLKALIKDKDQIGVDIRIVYGKKKKGLRPDERQWLDSLPSVSVFYKTNLHTKCYMNERQALLTSMNLYEFSQVTNDEMGLLIKKTQEPQLYDQIFDEAKRILRDSEEIGAKVASVKGFCIRCKTTIPQDRKKPYCKRCYNSWKRFENYSYLDKYCHRCGKEYESTMLDPVCRRSRCQKLAKA